MYKILSELIQAHYYRDRAECMSIVNTILAARSLASNEYDQLIILIDDCYPEPGPEVSSDSVA